MQRPAGFPRQVRLLRRREFDGVFKNPGRSADHYFTILFKSSNQPHNRLGLAIAKRVAKRAVDRNRIKRLLRESFRQQQVLPAVDLVVMTKTTAVTASNEMLFSSLNKHWQRIKRKHNEDV